MLKTWECSTSFLKLESDLSAFVFSIDTLSMAFHFSLKEGLLYISLLCYGDSIDFLFFMLPSQIDLIPFQSMSRPERFQYVISCSMKNHFTSFKTISTLHP